MTLYDGRDMTFQQFQRAVILNFIPGFFRTYHIISWSLSSQRWKRVGGLLEAALHREHLKNIHAQDLIVKETLTLAY